MDKEKGAKREDFGSIVRIYNTDLSGKKQVGVGLSKIRGIGVSFSHAVLYKAGIPDNKLIGQLSESEINKIEAILKNPIQSGLPQFMVNRQLDLETGQSKQVMGSDLKLQTEFDIRRMKRIRSYKGIRHGLGLKVRGQRTRSTGRKGGAIVSKKKVVKK